MKLSGSTLLVPGYMRSGIVTKVIPNKNGSDWFTQYEVNFGNQTIANFDETQSRKTHRSAINEKAPITVNMAGRRINIDPLPKLSPK